MRERRSHIIRLLRNPQHPLHKLCDYNNSGFRLIAHHNLSAESLRKSPTNSDCHVIVCDSSKSRATGLSATVDDWHNTDRDGLAIVARGQPAKVRASHAVCPVAQACGFLCYLTRTMALRRALSFLVLCSTLRLRGLLIDNCKLSLTSWIALTYH